MRFWTLAVVICLSGFGSAGLLADENDKARKQEPADRAESYQHLLKRFDRDGDGRLNDQERQAARTAWEQKRQQAGNQNRSARDANSRNRSAGSNARNRSTDRNRSTTARRADVLKRFDENRNGKLDPPEQAKLRQSMSRSQGGDRNRSQRPSGNPRMSREELLKRFDANQNGRIDGEEMKKVRATFDRRDRDTVRSSAPKRGRLDREELLKKFDLDNNGKLDADERKQALDAMRKKKNE